MARSAVTCRKVYRFITPMSTPSSSVQAFLQELAVNSIWKREIEALAASSPDALNDWLTGKGFSFTAAEWKGALEGMAREGGSELSGEILERISGGITIQKR